MKVILTGVTGMVGEGVLHECLNAGDVTEVVSVSRKPCGISHVKLKEVIHNDFFNIKPVLDQVQGYDALFFCMGVSSVGMKKEVYNRLTYDLTTGFCRDIISVNPGLVITYVSGAGTDSTETSRGKWQAIKGKTENELVRLTGGKTYNFRPGYMRPTPGAKNVLGFVKYVDWMYPFLRPVFPGLMCTLAEVGQAMIHVAKNGYHSNVVEVKDAVAIVKMRKAGGIS